MPPAHLRACECDSATASGSSLPFVGAAGHARGGASGVVLGGGGGGGGVGDKISRCGICGRSMSSAAMVRVRLVV